MSQIKKQTKPKDKEMNNFVLIFARGLIIGTLIAFAILALTGCSDGRDGADGAMGPMGPQGVQGEVGPQGPQGEAGEDAPASEYTIVELIDPCGPTSDFNEVLFRTAGGTILAHYSHGNKQFLTELRPGSYVTTDYQQCYFTVNADNTVTW